MSDYRLMFSSEFLYAFHLQGKDATVEIESVKAGEVTGEGGRKAKKPIVRFKGKELPLAVNKTNAKVIAGMYGTETSKWVGKKITLYPTTTSFGGEQKDCIRVRPKVPSGAGNTEYDEQAPEPGSNG